MFWWLSLCCLGVLGKEWTSDRRPVRFQSRYVHCEVKCVFVAVPRVCAETDSVCYRLQTLHHRSL